MEAYYAFVKKLVDAFTDERLDYTFTGALAVSFHGVPRTTSDVDVMTAVTKEEFCSWLFGLMESAEEKRPENLSF